LLDYQTQQRVVAGLLRQQTVMSSEVESQLKTAIECLVCAMVGYIML